MTGQIFEKIHKHGIKLSKMVEEAYVLDKENGKTMWADVITKEMQNIYVTFKVLP